MQNFSYENEFYLHENTVADSDLQIRGGAVIQTLRYGEGAVSKKKISPPPPKKKFRPFGPPFGLKIRGGGWAPRTPPLDPPLG